MQMSVVVGKSIRNNGNMIVIQEGERTDSYNRKYYRSVSEAGEPVALVITKKLPVKLVFGQHGILAPVRP